MPEVERLAQELESWFISTNSDLGNRAAATLRSQEATYQVLYFKYKNCTAELARVRAGLEEIALLNNTVQTHLEIATAALRGNEKEKA